MVFIGLVNKTKPLEMGFQVGQKHIVRPAFFHPSFYLAVVGLGFGQISGTSIFHTNNENWFCFV